MIFQLIDFVQELANPQVRPHLKFYPQDGKGYMKDVRHGKKWLVDMDPELLTPMARLGTDDYYIFEPALLMDGSVVMPTRWFSARLSPVDEEIFGKGWKMVQVNSQSGVRGWRICSHDEVTFNLDMLLWNYERFKNLSHTRGIPPPDHIWGIQRESGGDTTRWDLEKYPLPNRWRSKSEGHRVVSLPIWLYCDDTSGNRSKKWNEHNSYLFILAGLPREEAQREYNVHFLCTSNLAPPLEMLDGVAEQIE